jgi:hypothetical protein
MSKLAKLLPFLDNGDIKELAMKIINKEVEGVKLMMVFPFLDSEDLSQIIDLLIEKKDVKNLRYSVPFASRKKIDEIYNAVKDGKLEGFNESFLYPFLGQEKLKEMFDQYVKEAAEKGGDAEDKDDELDEEFDDE